MVLGNNKLFKAFGADKDDERKRKLRDILEGINGGGQVEVAQPIVQPATETVPRQMEPLPQAPPGQFNSTEVSIGGEGRTSGPPAPQQPVDYYAEDTPLGDVPGFRDMVQRQNEPKSAKISREIQEWDDPHKHSLLGRLFKGFGRSWMNATPETGGLFGVIGDTVRSVADPKYYSELENRDRQAPLFRKLAQTQQQEAFDAKQANIYEDNRRLAQVADDRKATQNATLLQKKREAWFRTRKFFDPAKATDADRRQLAEIGETPEGIGKYDFTKPDTKTIAGRMFKYDPNTGAFEDTNIKDDARAIVEYEITDSATGVKHKYATTSERAAALKTQLEAAGMQIEAAKERQITGNTHQEKMERIRAEYRQQGQRLAAKLAEIKAEKDHTRRLELEKEAAKLREDGIRLRAQLDEN